LVGIGRQDGRGIFYLVHLPALANSTSHSRNQHSHPVQLLTKFTISGDKIWLDIF
jgi:hypothetical protein